MSEETGVRATYRIVGVVQGVGFRYWAQRQAQRLGLRGTVRNRPDGSVEVDMQGSPAAVAKMVELLGRGPSGASVARVEPMASGTTPLAPGFLITR